ncbi:MAG: hypothetical protein IJV69_07445 [Kiritimatiellae bacterium]|nr:hypothetical protein [Kiritimatiellia bacterium]
MKKPTPTEFDFVYAVRNTEILHAPQRILDPFNQTSIEYTLLTQPMDNPHQTCIREGTLQTFPPHLLLPGNLSTQELEGFGPEAEKYLNFLQTRASQIRILRYSYRLRRETYRETIVNEPLALVRDQAKERHEQRPNPYAALVQGVDEPWDVCLLHLFMKLVQASVPKALDALDRRAKDQFKEHLPQDNRQEIERAFAAARQDTTLIPQLGKLLKEKGLFEVYQDRFFALLD